MFSENCVKGLYAANKAILFLESLSCFNQMKSFSEKYKYEEIQCIFPGNDIERVRGLSQNVVDTT